MVGHLGDAKDASSRHSAGRGSARITLGETQRFIAIFTTFSVSPKALDSVWLSKNLSIYLSQRITESIPLEKISGITESNF